MEPHRIHLKGPWTFEWVERDGTAAEAGEPERVQMPVGWRQMFGSMAGRVRFCRPFGRPTNLDAEERVHLCFDGIGGSGVISLNNDRLGELDGHQEKTEFEVTGWLQPRNVLVVELSFDPGETTESGGLWGAVALEIA